MCYSRQMVFSHQIRTTFKKKSLFPKKAIKTGQVGANGWETPASLALQLIKYHCCSHHCQTIIFVFNLLEKLENLFYSHI